MPPRPAQQPRPRLTHFLCIPLVTATSKPQLQKSLTAFKENVTMAKADGGAYGIPERAIRPLGTLHLTLGVMSLATTDKVDSAVQLLKQLDLKSIIRDSMPKHLKATAERPGETGSEEQQSLQITLQGLQSMHEVSKTSILYSSPVDEDLRLYSFCVKLRDIFQESRLLVSDTRPLLLHATILNTIYVPGSRDNRSSGHGRSSKAKLTIDAMDLLQEYEEMKWMKEVSVEKVAICRMGAQKLENGEEEYVVEAQVDIPT